MSPRLSIAQAAQHACISPEHWGNIERGHQSQGGGQSRIIIPPADTLAHMAHVVGVRPEELVAIGRQDAADLLREIIARRQPETTTAVVTKEPQRLQLAKWFTAELERRGLAVDTVVTVVTSLMDLARHWGYSLDELLVESGMADQAEVTTSARSTKDQLDKLRQQLQQIVNDPRLSPGQRRDAKRRARQVIADLERRFGS